MITIINYGGQGLVRNAPAHVTRPLFTAFSIANPLWHKLSRMGKTKALWACPKEFKYYKYDKLTGDITLPRGALEHTIKMIKSAGERVHLVEDMAPLMPLGPGFFRKVPTLRTYQQGYVESILKEKCGVLRLDTGWGKTILGLELARSLNLRTLIVVRGLTELDQWRNTARDLMGTEIGVIQGKHKDIKDVTVATAQTLSRRQDCIDLARNSFPVVLIDEVHTACSKIRRALIQSLKPTYLYGLTATDRRTDGQGKAINFLVGEKICDGTLPKETPAVHILTSASTYSYVEYSELAGLLAANPSRNNLIVERAAQERRSARNPIILCKRRSHCELLLQSFIERDLPAVYIDARASRDARAELFAKLRARQQAGQLPIILGTYSLLATGFDLPALDTLFLAGDLRSDVLQVQSIGRILRLFHSKRSTKIIDFWDKGDPILNHQFKERLKLYKTSNWNIVYG